MSGVSPSSVLFSSDGTELAVVNNTTVPTGTRALLIAGVNTNNTTDYVSASLGGALGTVSLSNNIPVQVNATVTASGSFTTSAGSFLGTQEIALVVNVGTVTGAGSIQYTIQELDPGDNVTLYGNSATTSVITTGNAPGVFTAILNFTSSSQVKITWTVTGTFSAAIYSTITTKQTPLSQTINGTVAVSSVGGTVAVTQSTSPWVVSVSNTVTVTGTVISNQGTPNTLANAWPITLTDGYGNIQGSAVNPIYVTGSISATNPSVGSNNATALGFDTQVGGIVATAAPTLANGNLSALSLTTLGGLRIDGVYAVATANATAADVMNSGGYVTTAAPTYTTGQLNPLSLDTTGNVRTTNPSVGTDAATALGFNTQVGGIVTTAAPTYTTGQLNALSLTTVGGLRLDAHYPVGTTNTNAPDMGVVGGYVTQTNPIYTTGQIEPLSITTDGYLRTTGYIVQNKALTSGVTNVTVTANANNALLTANSNRVFASIYNDTNKTLYIKCGTTASTSSFTTQLFSRSYWEVPADWQGELDAFAPSGASGSILLTELTP
ncbi:MAG: beta strand repeat-containing protein [Nitrosotalea sp.]